MLLSGSVRGRTQPRRPMLRTLRCSTLPQQAASAEQLMKMVDMVVQIKVLQRDLDAAGGDPPEAAAAPTKGTRIRFDS